MRHLLFLTSVFPDFSHFKAARTVCALLAQAFSQQVEKVTVGVCCPSPDMPRGDGVAQMQQLGISVVELPASRVSAPPPAGKLGNFMLAGRSVLLDRSDCDFPRPGDARTLAAAIDAVGADAALLFWDTLAEFALPSMRTPAFGYLAKPPHDSGAARARAADAGVRRSVNLAMFSAQERRHLRRLRHLRAAVNICARDAAYYSAHAVPCGYVSNTWGDPVGPDWQERRRRAEATRSMQILGNIGALDATGNTFGISYLAREILPALERSAPSGDWSVALCGQGRLSPDLAAALDRPRVKIKGFVDDIDEEMLSSAIFLLLNNAGPYTGGYTRVIYAFATGACLVAHDNLRQSMPELVSGENCLLADTPEGITRHLQRAIADPALRARLGAAARRTYETRYAPRHVAAQLVTMMQGDLHAKVPA